MEKRLVAAAVADDELLLVVEIRSLAADIIADRERVFVGELGALGDGFFRGGLGTFWLLLILSDKPALSGAFCVGGGRFAVV